MDFNFILVIIIFAYLVYCFFKTRKKEEKAPASLEKATAQENITANEKHVVAAVIATLMSDKKYIIKSVFAVGSVNDKKSAWKISGRQESMNTRLFFRKK